MTLTTSKGEFKLGDAKLILAMGTLPPTTLMLNSFPSSSFPMLRGIGTQFTSHFISSIIARTPLSSSNINMFSAFEQKTRGRLEMAAVYIAGKNKESEHQFHIQLTAIIDQTPLENIYDTMRHLPDMVAAPTLQQLISSKETPHVLFVCACLGQLDHNNKDNCFASVRMVVMISPATPLSRS